VRAEAQRARALLEASQATLVVSHERPDGDAVGSLLALVLGLRAKGKRAEGLLTDGVPGRYAFLPGAGSIVRALPETYDLVVAVDCSTTGRMGFDWTRTASRPSVNIDHHPTNTRFAEANLVDPEAAATAQVLYGVASDLGLSVDRDIATNLLAGIVTDTIGFRTSNVSVHVLRITEDLLQKGAPLAEIYERTLNRHSFTDLRYWGRGLSRLSLQDSVVWASLTLDDRRSTTYPGNDDADLINLLATTEGAQVAVIFVEQSGNKIKISWRCREGLNVARLAEQFGGGGHELASGAVVEGTLAEVEQRVLAATRVMLEPARG
jgi:phosphoesterase RecJ-like protein